LSGDHAVEVVSAEKIETETDSFIHWTNSQEKTGVIRPMRASVGFFVCGVGDGAVSLGIDLGEGGVLPAKQ